MDERSLDAEQTRAAEDWQGWHAVSGLVRVRPGGLDLHVCDGETIMSAAIRAGYRWPTVCGGQGTCRTCFVLVESGAENCSGISSLEAEGIDAIRRTVTGDVRLACQLRLTGGVATVHKRGVRPVRKDSLQPSDEPTEESQ